MPRAVGGFTSPTVVQIVRVDGIQIHLESSVLDRQSLLGLAGVVGDPAA